MKHPSAAAVLAIALVYAFPTAGYAAAPSLPSTAQIKRGEYLVKATGCADCHAPLKMGPRGLEPDLARGLSGHPQDITLPPAPKTDEPWVWSGSATNTAYAGPWGVSYATNLTPDNETGIGAWRPEDFIKAIRTGRHAGAGRPIMPPMPWAAYRNFTDGDLKAIYLYLRSRPAVRNRVPEYQPPQKQ
ncbi:MAG: c-type cytochrome [Rhodospirillaceae bacterium]